MSSGPPRIVGTLPDGSNVWQVGAMYAVSWDDAITIPDDPKEKVPRVTGWFESPQAARLAWEIAQVEHPDDPLYAKIKERYSVGFTDWRGIFGSSS